MTRVDISYAVNKLAKHTRKPGNKHFEVLLHLLRYLHDSSYLGLCYYSNIDESPLTKMLTEQNLKPHHPFYGFSDSSWNDDQDTAEAEYNEGCIAFMTASHLQMLLCKLEGVDESSKEATPIYFDSKSALAMGNSYKDTKHTHHIMHWYHYIRENISAK